MAHKFDGNGFAREIKQQLAIKVKDLEKQGIRIRLVSLMIGKDEASRLYLSLKRKIAHQVGINMQVLALSADVDIDQIIYAITKLNGDESVQGIMVQLPLPNSFSLQDRQKILASISGVKDVDGLKPNSPFMPATVRAVIKILEFSEKIVRRPLKNRDMIAVVGAKGMVGTKLTEELNSRGFKVAAMDIEDFNKDILVGSGVVISATGKPGLINASMIKDGAVIIDVGSPKGDVQYQEVLNKVSFITPVPGGVGPVTIVSLLENLVEAAESQSV